MFFSQPPYLPARLGNLRFWTAGDRSAKTFNGSNVSQWNDLSSSSDNLVQATASKQLLYVPNSLNGLPGLLGDGMVDRMTVTFGSTITQPATILTVFKTSVIGDNSYIYDGIVGTNRMLLVYIGGTPPTALSSFAGVSLVSAVLEDTSPHFFVCEFNGANSKIRLDGVEIASGNVGSDTLTGMSILARFGDTGHINGTIYEQVVRDKILSASELAYDEFYLKNKYGI